ncbi:uncharacterized protein [Periplaneta americana]|uniref:uncharacterized protein n=1 Tax=Periplaneta americana TaxID=6978 RepID=UPI0037E83D59
MMEESSERPARVRPDPCLELARQRAELLGLPPPPEPRPAPVSQNNTIPSSPPPSYEHVLAETRLAAAQAETACRTPDEDADEAEKRRKKAAVMAAAAAGTVAKRPEILHKSSKELYRAVAAQWGITCKMSDHCRCLDCQSRYFDCEYDQTDQEKSEGALDGIPPSVLSGGLQGTPCNIL